MDCFRRAVHYGYGIPLDELPDPVTDDTEEFWIVWNSWAMNEHGMYWWFSAGKAPISAHRWFASVYSPWANEGEQLHAVVMAKFGLLLDPNSVGGDGGFQPVELLHRSAPLDSVINATVLIPRGATEPPGPFAPIGGVMSIVGSANMGSVPVNVDSEVALKIYPSGNWLVDFNGRRALSGNQSVFATGGTLASGKSGIIDWYFLPNANTRTYKDFGAAVPEPEEAAIFPGRSLVWGYDGSLTREASGGTNYAYAAGQQGVGVPMLGPAGTEGLSNRLTIASDDTSPDLGATGNPCPRLDYVVTHRPAYLLGRHQT